MAENRRNKQELERQYRFLDTIIESLPQPFYVIDVKTYETVLSNTAAKQHLKAGNITCHSLLFGRNKPCANFNHYCPMPDVTKTKIPVTFERKYRDKNGNVRFSEINAYPVFDTQGKVIQMIEHWVDITARKELEQTLKETLEKRNKELTSKAMHIAQDRELLISVIEDVRGLYLKSQNAEKAQLKHIISKLNEQVNSDRDWEEFKLWFQEVHQDFHSILMERYPDLTPREMKICAFLKLHLNTKEMARLTRLSVKTIEVYRTQLRKKLKLKPGENLYKFLSALA